MPTVATCLVLLLALAEFLSSNVAAGQAQRDGRQDEQGLAVTALPLLAERSPDVLPVATALAASATTPAVFSYRVAQSPRQHSPAWTEAETFAVGNFNPTVTIHLGDGTPVKSHYKSSVGVGTEYRHWSGDHYAVGLSYVRNPSDGKLIVNPAQIYIWPLMRYEFAALATERFKVRWRLSPFVAEGPGFIVTQSLVQNSGWSENFALVMGGGVDYRITKRLGARAGLTIFDSAAGCYGDPTCHEAWGMTKDVQVGFAYRWRSPTFH